MLDKTPLSFVKIIGDNLVRDFKENWNEEIV